jgi:hypothetical protein
MGDYLLWAERQRGEYLESTAGTYARTRMQGGAEMGKSPTSVLPLSCLNCGGPLSDPQRPYLYCSELCRQEAKYVRYKRAKTREGIVDRPDIKAALDTQLAFIMGGGYPEAVRRLTKIQREAVFARDGGRCRLCGAPATQIDHIGAGPDGDINHPDNLRLLCERCHEEKTARSFREVTLESDPEEWWRCQFKFMELEQRVHTKKPARLCDDEQHWQKAWQGIARERAAIIKGTGKASGKKGETDS